MSPNNIYTLVLDKANQLDMEMEGKTFPRQIITLHMWRMNLTETIPQTTEEWFDNFHQECLDVYVVRDGQVHSVMCESGVNDWTIDEFDNTYVSVAPDIVWG